MAEKSSSTTSGHLAPAQARWQVDILYGLIPLMALAPMLLVEFRSAWERLHLRSFPLPIALVLLWLAWQMMGRAPRVAIRSRRRIVAYSVFLLAAMATIANYWMFSPWVAHACMVLCFAAWALLRLNSVGVASIFAFTVLLATSLRLPGALDLQVNQWFDGAAGSLCTPVLDSLAIPCLHLADTLTLRGIEFRVSEVSRNFYSVNAFLFMTILLCILQRRSLMAGCLSLLTLPVWFLIYKLLLLLSVVLLQHYAQWDVSRGREYALLASLLFVVVVVCHGMVMTCISRLCFPVPAADSDFEPEFQLLNRLLCWPQLDPFHVETELPTPIPTGEMPDSSPALPWDKIELFLKRTALAGVVGILVAGVALLTPVQAALRTNVPLPKLSVEQLPSIATQELIPAAVQEMRLVDFTSGMERAGELDRAVYRWRFGWQGQLVQLDLVLPFAQPPGVTEQMAAIGWKVLSFDVQRTVNAADEAAAGHFVSQLRLENELGGKSFLFSTTRAMPRPANSDLANPAPLFQVKLFCESGEPLSRPQIQRLRQLFDELVSKVESAVTANLSKLLGAQS